MCRRTTEGEPVARRVVDSIKNAKLVWQVKSQAGSIYAAVLFRALNKSRVVSSSHSSANVVDAWELYSPINCSLRKIHSPREQIRLDKTVSFSFLFLFFPPRAIIRCLMIFAFSRSRRIVGPLCSRATRKRFRICTCIPDESARGASLPGVNDSLRLSLGSFVPLQRATCSVPSPTLFRVDSSRRISIEDDASTLVNSR